ncbi:hypothetical protein HAZT_HAZT005051 [Hyalella azteca]|uniref:Uncharacterized protein n=1 Tax=Hyalella azteca TaxID=294128 RepID=A0A6A0GRF3_HYAAZ|nr:hypothetical protein HAZT_HAZT005051 [Hyalella azteca]
MASRMQWNELTRTRVPPPRPGPLGTSRARIPPCIQYSVEKDPANVVAINSDDVRKYIGIVLTMSHVGMPHAKHKRLLVIPNARF